ncbi:FeoA family protein [Neisseria dumasiana]|uniref:Iron transporter n=1 Tax=Neisseria dumasiana TaxID=1931275 RepID=A0A1X3DGS3_9NEIS|nr:FeoA family protein [Neisseria dumasiana]OSI19123.1 iron transporter [Neisseria dumasiana]
MSVVPLSQLAKGTCAHIESIGENPVFGELDALVSRRLADLGFSNGMLLMVMAVGVLGKGPFAVRLGNQSQFALRAPEAAKVMCRVVTDHF